MFSPNFVQFGPRNFEIHPKEEAFENIGLANGVYYPPVEQSPVKSIPEVGPTLTLKIAQTSRLSLPFL